MIHDEICTYEVAKLAREKGFNEYEACNHIYEDDEQWHTLTTYTNAKGIDWSKDKFTVAPTQSLLQRWLREEKNLYISIIAHAKSKRAYYEWEVSYISSLGNMKASSLMSIETYRFDTYELALEDALKYALGNLV